MSRINKICIVGAGSWGTALAILLGEKGYKVSILARRKEISEEINKTRKNSQYLKNIKIPGRVIATNILKNAVKDSDIIIFAIPSEFFRKTVQSFSGLIKRDTVIVHVAKGIEEHSGSLMSQVLKEELKRDDIVVLSGPNHAEEVDKKLPTATVVASESKNARELVAQVFYTPYFKTYTHDDVTGVEICSAIKNIVAIAI